MKNKLIKTEKNLDKKFLKFYTNTFYNEETGKEREYFFVSRNDLGDLVARTQKLKATAIEAFTYIKEGDEYYLVMIDEFRSAMAMRMLSFCAGLIDEGEQPLDAVEREVKEELGGKVKSIKPLTSEPLPTSAGLTDEANLFYLVELESLGKQELEETEDIKVLKIPVSKIQDQIDKGEAHLTLSGFLGIQLILQEIERRKKNG